MAPAKPTVEPKRKYFTVEEANRTLPLVRSIALDIVRQYKVVHALQQRLSAITSDARRPASDLYSEELAQTRAELQTEETTLREYVQELKNLGVELKSPEGLCDFRAIRDGREVSLCWQPGENEVAHWHELDDPTDRRPLAAESTTPRIR